MRTDLLSLKITQLLRAAMQAPSRTFIDIAKEQDRMEVVLTFKNRLIHYYEKFVFVNEGLTAKSTQGGAEWYQMRLSLLEKYARYNVKNLVLCKIFQKQN